MPPERSASRWQPSVSRPKQARKAGWNPPVRPGCAASARPACRRRPGRARCRFRCRYPGCRIARRHCRRGRSGPWLPRADGSSDRCWWRSPSRSRCCRRASNAVWPTASPTRRLWRPVRSMRATPCWRTAFSRADPFRHSCEAGTRSGPCSGQPQPHPSRTPARTCRMLRRALAYKSATAHSAAPADARPQGSGKRRASRSPERRTRRTRPATAATSMRTRHDGPRSACPLMSAAIFSFCTVRGRYPFEVIHLRSA